MAILVLLLGIGEWVIFSFLAVGGTCRNPASFANSTCAIGRHQLSKTLF